MHERHRVGVRPLEPIATTTTTEPAAPARATLISTQCDEVGLALNRDNVASAIVVTGMSCADADAFARKAWPRLGPLNGPALADVYGFTCVRTAQHGGRGVPTATYECMRGTQTISITRT